MPSSTTWFQTVVEIYYSRLAVAVACLGRHYSVEQNYLKDPLRWGEQSLQSINNKWSVCSNSLPFYSFCYRRFVSCRRRLERVGWLLILVLVWVIRLRRKGNWRSRIGTGVSLSTNTSTMLLVRVPRLPHYASPTSGIISVEGTSRYDRLWMRNTLFSEGKRFSELLGQIYPFLSRSFYIPCCYHNEFSYHWKALLLFADDAIEMHNGSCKILDRTMFFSVHPLLIDCLI